MSRSPLIVFVAFLLAFTACRFPGTSKAAKTPPAPNPTAAAAATVPAPPPELLSTPQTDVQLPPPQPVSPEALATIQPPPEPPPQEPPALAPQRPQRKQPAAQRAESAPPEPAPAPPPIAGAPPAEEPMRLQAVLTEDQRKRILADLDRRKTEIASLLRQINPRRQSQHQKNVVDNVHSLLKVAEDAAKRGDMTSADSLSERALILARELANER